VRVVEAFVEQLDLRQLGFEGAAPAATGRPGYHPAVLLKLYVYGYLNRIQSSRRLEREAQRNVELMWLTGRLAPDFKTIANFRKDNGPAIRAVCRQFIVLCRKLDLFTQALVAIDGSKFKAVNNRDKNFTAAKLKRRLAEIDAPEASQAFGQRSRQHLAGICAEQLATIKPQTTDRYGRTVARVECRGTDANAEQVRAGMAWAFTRYLTDPAIKQAEEDAVGPACGEAVRTAGDRIGLV
jgi:transposase